MDQEGLGLEREMGRMRVDDNDDDDGDYQDLEEEEEEVYDLPPPRRTSGQYHQQPPLRRTGGQYHKQYHGSGGRTGTRVWAAGAAARETDRDMEMRADRLRREEDRLIREEKEREQIARDDFIRRRDSGADVGVPFGESNPFTPRPGPVRRKGAAYPAREDEGFITL
jgi:hypothetical protein